MTDPAHEFRVFYDTARACGYVDTRASLAVFVLRCPGFKAPLVASARAWDRERRNEFGRVTLRVAGPPLGARCSRCDREDDDVVLAADGLCAVCASDRDERQEAAGRRVLAAVGLDAEEDA